MVLTGATAATFAILSALTSIGTSVGNMIYNSNEAEKNRSFQREMRNTAVSSLINQAEQNGISPSLLLGGGTSSSLGGSQASVNASSTGISNSVNSFLSYLQNEEKMKTLEEMQEDRLDYQKQIQESRNETMKEIARMNNSANSKNVYRKYNKEDFNKLYDNIDDLNF